MKRLVEILAKSYPQELKGYHLIKKQDIYIPYYEIGINCLVKEVTEINLFFETILKLVDIKVSDVYEISKIMGIEFKLLKEVIADMADQDYIFPSENRLIMTPRGKEALANGKLITIQKENIYDILINMITEDIEESKKIKFSKPSNKYICLDKEKKITIDFLENHYEAVNKIYQNKQSEMNGFNTIFLQSELYKILDITYENLRYIKQNLLIYENDNDSKNYEFVITGDINNQYLNCFYSQVKDVVKPGMENFFERDKTFARGHCVKNITNLGEKQYMQDLVMKLNRNKMISNEILDEYMHTRCVINNWELEMLFSYNMEFDYQGIIISAERLRNLLNTEIISVLNQISKKKIWLLYNPKEYNIKEFLEHNIGAKKKKNEINILENQNFNNQFICFYPNILVEFVEKTEKIFERYITIFEGHIEFESNIIQNKLDKIIEEHKISFSFSNSKKTKKKKYK